MVSQLLQLSKLLSEATSSKLLPGTNMFKRVSRSTMAVEELTIFADQRTLWNQCFLHGERFTSIVIKYLLLHLSNHLKSKWKSPKTSNMWTCFWWWANVLKRAMNKTPKLSTINDYCWVSLSSSTNQSKSNWLKMKFRLVCSLGAMVGCFSWTKPSINLLKNWN